VSFKLLMGLPGLLTYWPTMWLMIKVRWLLLELVTRLTWGVW